MVRSKRRTTKCGICLTTTQFPDFEEDLEIISLINIYKNPNLCSFFGWFIFGIRASLFRFGLLLSEGVCLMRMSLLVIFEDILES